MKTGKSLVDLATEIERQYQTKRDFIAPVTALRVDEAARLMIPMKAGEVDLMPMTDHGSRQVGSWANIPAPYFDRMKAEAPLLLAQNLNHWFSNGGQDKRMLRTLDGKLRAFLSQSFRPLENLDLANAALPALQQLGVNVLSAEITEKRLYIKAVDQRIERDVPKGSAMGDGKHTIFDTLCPAISISNSEVGSGSLSIEVGVFTRGCTNLAFFAERSMRKYHVGGKHELLGDNLAELLSENTQRLTNQAIWAQVGDVVKGAFEEARFDASIAKITDMTTQPLTGDPVKVVEIVGKQLGTTEGERTSILRHLIEGGDLSRYGLFNAVTRTGEDVTDYDRATDFERMGGKIIDLAANDWNTVLKQAA